MAKITRLSATDLLVENGGYQWRRIDGRWQMLSQAGAWFDCPIQDFRIQNQVDDFDNCLRTYTFEEGPPYPTGRKYYESIDTFIRQKQIDELRKDCRGIFKPVNLNYDAHAENKKRAAAAIRKILTAPFSSRYLTD